MLKINNVSLRFGTRTLFENVNLEFKDDNCYGIIGANGAGKSTFLKIISGEVESTKGEVIIGKNERISVLRQNHNEFDEYKVIDTVISGDTELYDIMKEKEAIYMKPDFSMEDGIRAGELEAKFEEKNGWQAESDAAILLAGLGLDNSCNDKFMSELEDKEKVKVLLARALFGEPNYETQNSEDAYSYILFVEPESSEKIYLEVYEGSSGPAIGGLNNAESLQAAETLKKLIEESEEVADYQYEGYYQDLDLKISMGIKNGVPYYNEEPCEEIPDFQ